jgi:hypothetical protein
MMKFYFRVLSVISAVVFAILLLKLTFRTMQTASVAQSLSEQVTDSRQYMPLVNNSYHSPVGSYNCSESEWGFLWRREIITLSVDGSSVYTYLRPSMPTIKGTWVYTPEAQIIGFTNFSWKTASYISPNQIWARRYEPENEIDTILNCSRR